jgi:hypothetical protein
MGMQVVLALAAGLLFGTASSEPVAKAQRDDENVTVITPENTIIKIAPGAKYRLHQVKTGQDNRIRLEMPGVTVEAVRLRIKSKGNIYEVQVGADTFTVRSFPDKSP